MNLILYFSSCKSIHILCRIDMTYFSDNLRKSSLTYFLHKFNKCFNKIIVLPAITSSVWGDNFAKRYLIFFRKSDLCSSIKMTCIYKYTRLVIRYFDRYHIIFPQSDFAGLIYWPVLRANKLCGSPVYCKTRNIN